MKKFIPFALAIILGVFISCTLDVPAEPVDNGSGNTPVINPTNPVDDPTNPPTGNPVDNPPANNQPAPTCEHNILHHKTLTPFMEDYTVNIYECQDCSYVFFDNDVNLPGTAFYNPADPNSIIGLRNLIGEDNIENYQPNREHRLTINAQGNGVDCNGNIHQIY